MNTQCYSKIYSQNKQISILFVDDDDSCCDVAAMALKSEGYNVVTAADGQEALDIFQANGQDFDLIITDFQMPKMDGVQLLEAIHAIDPRFPMILCSGQIALAQESLSLTGVIPLKKPYSAQSLYKTIDEALHSLTLASPKN